MAKKQSETVGPGLEEIRELKREMELYWDPQKKKDDKILKLYFNEHEVEPPNPNKGLIAQPYVLRQGRGGEIVDHAVGLLDVRGKISIQAAGKKFEAAEHFANLARPKAEREQGEDTNRRLTWDVVTIGYSAVKVFPAPNLWRGRFPLQEAGEGDASYNRRQQAFAENAPLPIAVWHVPGRTWYPLLNGRNVMRSLECKRVTKSWVEARYGDRLDGPDRDRMRELAKELDFVEYVDDRVCGWYIFGPHGSDFVRELRVWEHCMPVEPGVAPVRMVEGFTTGDTRPGYRWKSLLDDIHDAIIAQDLAISRTATMVLLFYWITVIHRIKKGQGLEDLEKLRKKRAFKLGGTNFVLENEELELLGLPAQLPDAAFMYNTQEQRIQRAWPAVLQGLIDGSSSGYLANLVRDAALSKIKPLADNLAEGDAAIADLLFKALGALEKILGRENLKVYVRRADEAGSGIQAIGVTHAETRDLSPLLEAKRDADMPIDKNAKIDAAIKAWQELKLPWAHVVTEIYGAENPEELQEMRFKEDVMASQPVLDRAFGDVLQEMDLILNETEGMDIAEVSADGRPKPPALMEALGVTEPTAEPTVGSPGAAAAAAEMVGPEPERKPSRRVSRTQPRAGTKTQPGGKRATGRSAASRTAGKG